MEPAIRLEGGTPGVPRKRKLYTYFISGGDGRVKIGKAVDVARRLKTLQTGSSRVLKLLHVIDGDVERGLHAKFSQWRIQGEWFEACEELLAFVEKLRA